MTVCLLEVPPRVYFNFSFLFKQHFEVPGVCKLTLYVSHVNVAFVLKEKMMKVGILLPI